MSVSVSIIIVSYNVKYFLEQCLHTVRRSGAGLCTEVIVVDNASSDGSLGYLIPLFPEVRFVDAGANLGFAKACNLGYRYATGSHVLFLNPDVLLSDETLTVALRFLLAHPDAGAVGVRMVDGSGHFLPESKRGFPTPAASLSKLLGLHRLFPRSAFFNRYYLGHLPEHSNHRVEVLAGAFMLLPRAVLERTGLFDEAFFMYGEDIDLSYRIHRAGYHNYYLADTSIVHFKGESTQRGTLRYVRLFYTAMAIFVKKHYRGAGGSLFRLLLLAGIWMRAAVTILATAAGHLKRRQVRQAPPQATAVFAGSAEYEQIAGTLCSLGAQPVRLRRLNEATTLHPKQELVLCLSQMPLARYLAWMAQQQIPFRYRFHLPGSGSLVGSPSSNGNGWATALQPPRKAPAGPAPLAG